MTDLRAPGTAACWCALPFDQHDATRDHEPRKPSPSVRSGATLCLIVWPLEHVSADVGTFEQRRAMMQDRTGHVGRAHFVRMTRAGERRWLMDWADEHGWRMAATAAAAGWLDRIDHGPDTYGHSEYLLP